MASVFKTSTATPTSPVNQLRVQTSLQGMPRPIVWGMTRLAGNLIDYTDFYAVAVQQQSSGKGGMFGAPSGGSGYNYYASVEIGLCEGPVVAIGPVMWADQARSGVSGPGGNSLDDTNRIISGLTVNGGR